MNAFDPAILKVGDVLFYTPSDLVGYIIGIKTWTWLSHVEVYIGGGKAIGARLKGVNIYDLRVDKHLVYVRRPVMNGHGEFDPMKALGAVASTLGTPYDIGSFEAFFNPWSRNRHSARICSTNVAAYLKGGGCEVFNPDLDPDDISPAQLWQTPHLKTIWTRAKP
jgi:hypothetical protein